MPQNIMQRSKVRRLRAMRVRKKLRGTSNQPRFSVFKSLNHIGVQLIDDENGITLASFSTLSKEMRGKKLTKESAREVGEKIGEMANEKKIDRVVFDRGRHKYHGLIAEVANGARDKGVKF